MFLYVFSHQSGGLDLKKNILEWHRYSRAWSYINYSEPWLQYLQDRIKVKDDPVNPNLIIDIEKTKIVYDDHKECKPSLSWDPVRSSLFYQQKKIGDKFLTKYDGLPWS